MKKYICLSAAFTLVLIWFTGCSGPAAYRTFSSNTGLFSVDLPRSASPMEKQAREIETSAGAMDMDFYISYGEETIFMIGVLAHGMPEINKDLTMESLLYSRDMLGENADITETHEFLLNGRPAVSIRYTKKQGDDNLYAYGVITDIEGIQYQIQTAAYDPEVLNRYEAVRFQLSFQYTGGPQERRNSLNSETVVK